MDIFQREDTYLYIFGVTTKCQNYASGRLLSFNSCTGALYVNIIIDLKINFLGATCSKERERELLSH